MKVIVKKILSKRTHFTAKHINSIAKEIEEESVKTGLRGLKIGTYEIMDYLGGTKLIQTPNQLHPLK